MSRFLSRWSRHRGDNGALNQQERDTAALPATRPTGNRLTDLKQTYEAHTNRLKSTAPKKEALEAAVGGLFDVIGPIEVGILRFYGLGPNDHLIDVGCGSGRLAKPLSEYLRGKYSGFDVVDDLVQYALTTVNRPDWRFQTIDHISIPEQDEIADMVCFFSVFTHLLHEQTYWYLQESIRVLKPGGKIVFSFLEFREPDHWPIFLATLDHTKCLAEDPINVFISREAIEVWATHLGLQIEAIRNASDAIAPDGPLGQSLCVLRRPLANAT